MFKFFAVALLASVICIVSAYPQSDSTPVPIVSQSQQLDVNGAFNYAYQTGDGTSADAQGELKSIKVPKVDASGAVVGEEDGQGTVQRGKYSYTAPDGSLITVNWIADENGFQPDNLPVAPVARK